MNKSIKKKYNIKLVFRLIITLILWVILFFWALFVPRRFQYRFLWPIFSKMFLFGAKLKVHWVGQLNIKKLKNVIFAVNHRSFADTFIITSLLRKPFTFTLIDWMIKEPIFKFLIIREGLIPINKKDIFQQKKSLKKILKMLKKGYSLVYFPEGEFVYNSPIGELKPGIAKIAKDSGCMVIPLVIYGGGKDKDFLYEDVFKWRDIYVIDGKPLRYNDFNDREQFLKELKERMGWLYQELEKKYS